MYHVENAFKRALKRERFFRDPSRASKSFRDTQKPISSYHQLFHNTHVYLENNKKKKKQTRNRKSGEIKRQKQICLRGYFIFTQLFSPKTEFRFNFSLSVEMNSFWRVQIELSVVSTGAVLIFQRSSLLLFACIHL